MCEWELHNGCRSVLSRTCSCCSAPNISYSWQNTSASGNGGGRGGAGATSRLDFARVGSCGSSCPSASHELGCLWACVLLPCGSMISLLSRASMLPTAGILGLPIGLPGCARSNRPMPVRVAPSGCPRTFETVMSTRCQLQREIP